LIFIKQKMKVSVSFVILQYCVGVNDI